MISCCYVKEFNDLKEYVDDYLLDLLNPDGTNHIPRLYGVDRILEFKNAHGKTVGMIKYTPINETNAVSFHPMFRKAHKIYTLKCINIAFECIAREGFSSIFFVFPASNQSAEKMAKHVGARMVNEIPNGWIKNEKQYSMLVYQLDLGLEFYERTRSH